ncbi:methylisocitrate lyase [Salinibacillus kushneri]|uniref:Methylisocitrate lyase n=1 Tax=Salinibacillus kushneri TaxID=237682 RepID=A0A1H9YWC5_9BACI|nr:methylisocitrate lyase [Salinibacillus kushneri]SES73450.1 methylisocitrate lyase [Salinibacillus kushneri]
MTWLTHKSLTQEELAGKFRKKINQKSILKIPGAHDAMAGLMAKKTGFEALYLSGAAYTASRGLPDLGVITSEEMADRAKDLVRATNLPVLVDIDTGFGGILNVARTVKEMLEANVAAVQIEDQDSPKKCGHLNGKKLVTTEEMVQKIHVIRDTVPTLVIVARTDAYGVEGIDSTLKRAKAYEEAGVDAIFPEALPNEEEFQRLKQEISVPLLANMTEFGKTPYYTAKEFEKFGYQMVIYPVTSMRVAAKAYERVYQEILEKGTQIDSINDMQTRKELYDTINYYEYEELDYKIAKTILE